MDHAIRLPVSTAVSAPRGALALISVRLVQIKDEQVVEGLIFDSPTSLLLKRWPMPRTGLRLSTIEELCVQLGDELGVLLIRALGITDELPLDDVVSGGQLPDGAAPV